MGCTGTDGDRIPLIPYPSEIVQSFEADERGWPYHPGTDLDKDISAPCTDSHVGIAPEHTPQIFGCRRKENIHVFCSFTSLPVSDTTASTASTIFW